MSYLDRDKGGRYFYRRAIPAELRPVMPAPFTGKTNWKRALGTADPAIAKKNFAKVQAQCEADFDEARRQPKANPPRSTDASGNAFAGRPRTFGTKGAGQHPVPSELIQIMARPGTRRHIQRAKSGQGSCRDGQAHRDEQHAGWPTKAVFSPKEPAPAAPDRECGCHPAHRGSLFPASSAPASG